MRNSWTYLDKEPTFEEWLLAEYDTTPFSLRLLCQKTAFIGVEREYNAMMRWYRYRYRKDMEERKRLLDALPFT